MIIGFDLDGTLDREHLAKLAHYLMATGNQVHIITGMFPEDEAPWQNREEKRKKVERLGLSGASLHIVEALPITPTRNLDYVLRDINLQKGALISKHGIEVMFDDSPMSEMMKAFCGATIVRVL